MSVISKDTKDLIVGLDIGTSKVVALVAELNPDGQFNVVGLGQVASKGLKKGVVVNIEATVQSIQKALEEAEVMADRRIAQVFTGIAGNHIHSFNSTGIVLAYTVYGNPASHAVVLARSKVIAPAETVSDPCGTPSQITLSDLPV